MGELTVEQARAISTHRQQAAALLLYQCVLEDAVGQALLQLLLMLTDSAPPADCLAAYGRWFAALAATGRSWGDHLVYRVLEADTPWARAVQQDSPTPAALTDAVGHDLGLLQSLHQLSPTDLQAWVAARCDITPVVWSPPGQPLPLALPPAWADGLDLLATYYRRHGSGLFGLYHACRWHRGAFQGIPQPDPIHLGQLAAYDGPRQTLLQNTEFLLAGFPALNVLLYGGRGTGKSSLVKALVNEYGGRGLRLVEVPKAELHQLPTIVEELRSHPQKFIIFVDDLSFEEDDDGFKALKVVLEGGITRRPDNVVVYATSNRRHLVREFFDDRPRPRDADELKSWDTVQEKLSFSDRFGLTLTFEPADQPTYLTIVRHLAAQAQLEIAPEDLEFRARQWATRHNGRSGRSARQFIDFLTAELALGQAPS